MEIIGYSERGAMNALFYGMAIRNDNDAMRRFLELAGITESYTNYRLYTECSLSDFGTPDLVIIADKVGEIEKSVFFVEAKVSHCLGFDLKKQLKKHEDINQYDASNLFFQLRSKEYFFNCVCRGEGDPIEYENRIKCKKGKQGDENCRVTGSNVVVNKFADKIGKCTSAEYIAIIPEQEGQKEYTFETNNNIKIAKAKDGKSVINFGTWKAHIVTWEDIYSNFKDYVGKTIEFNQNDSKSQIMNQPIDL